jgi:signal transduction histidine kinase
LLSIPPGASAQPVRAEATGDRVLLERMIGNLVDNAVRHNAHGGWIRLRSGGLDGQAFIEVINSGPFLPEDGMPSLFEPFHSLAGRTGDGVGLGLSIVKAVGDAHNAAVEAHARPEGGLLVSVVLPRTVPTSSPPA